MLLRRRHVVKDSATLTTSETTAPKAAKPKVSEVRAWAAAQEPPVEVPASGAIKKDVYDQYAAWQAEQAAKAGETPIYPEGAQLDAEPDANPEAEAEATEEKQADEEDVPKE